MGYLPLLPPIPSDDLGTRSWWQSDLVRDGERAPSHPLTGMHETDVVIVGGGFTGLWTALTLKHRAPEVRVVIVEAYRCGDGASGRNGGNVHGYWGALPTLLPLLGADGALEVARLGTIAQAKLRRFVKGCGDDVWWVEEGYIRAASSAAQMVKADALVATARELGVGDAIRPLDRSAIASLCDSPRFVGGIFQEEGATVHPARLVRALRAAVEALGVTIHEDSPVHRLSRGTPTRLEAAGGEITARDVVLATYTGTMAVPAVSRRTTLFSSFPVMSMPSEDALERMGYGTGRGIADLRMFTHYFRRTRDGRILMGSGSGPIAFGRDHGNIRLRIDAPSSRRAALGLASFFPDVARAGIESTWGWPIEVSADRLPYFGTIAGSRIHYGSGYTGHGVNATCIAGECIASLVLGTNDRWSNSPFCRRSPVSFPPEPLRYAGGTMVRKAIVRCEDALDAGAKEPLAAKAISAIPLILGMKTGTR